ncbi:hypothetical protein [Streptomyces apricus]|uniref:Uncharacterized protein n=1 Tax=Streptomyces apricus TaxID=1828112 RepID=A0A5B0ALX4_9ACTN|nr:hypothetical protein [Streptomyces apricus]KAA0930206.1 hypothetical protein FGF04_26560 [Streptomyces apricus]
MSNVAIECTVDGQPYSAEQLDTLRHVRNLHVLHQMKRLGASIELHDNPLSDDEIDFLGAEDAHDINVATTLAYGPEGIRKLFAEPLRTSDRLWKEWNAASAGLPLQQARAEIKVTGVTLEEFRAHVVDFDELQKLVVAANPDHFFFCPQKPGVARAMETFGMYGTPTEVLVASDPDLPAPFDLDEGFQLFLAGHTELADDNTPIDIIAYHQCRPLPDGIHIKLCALFPAKAPKELVEGHRLHLAVEFAATLEMIAAAR